MSDNNVYQKVFFRTGDEKEQNNLLSKFRHGSTSPKQYKRWSPEISEQERSVKKREREEAYVKGLKEENKPFFFIQKKEVFTNPKDVKQMNDSLQGKYYKIIKNTQEVDDIQSDVNKLLKGANRQTVIHGEAPTEDPFNIESIFKIEGIEYLPEGFLELEPLLYYDEYFFDDHFDEKRFLEEQRKIKHIRRKQYSQKDVKKKREVTLFVVDKYKDRLAEYLELWYAQNMRRMKDEEIEYVAKELEVDFNTIAQLQEVFLKKKKFENAARLSNYLAPADTRDERLSLLPQGLQKHFSDSIPSSSMSKKGSQIRTSKTLDGSKGNRPSNVVEINDAQNEVKEQFQVELDGVLHKIRNSSAKGFNQSGNRESAIELNESGLKKQRSTANSKSPNQGSGNKVRIPQTIEDAMNNSIRNSQLSPRTSSNNQQQFSNKGQGSLQRVSTFSKPAMDAKVTFTEVDESGLRKGNVDTVEIIQKAPTINLPQYASSSFQANVDQKAESINLGRNSKSSLQPSNIFTARAKTVIGADSSQYSVNRLTIASKSASGRIFVEQKLRPTLICNDYYYQMIEDVIDEYGNHKVTVITKNELGEIVASQNVGPENLGNFHHSILFEPVDLTKSKSLIIRNEMGDTLCITPIEASTFITDPSSIHAVHGDDGERKSTIRVTKNQSNLSIINLGISPARSSSTGLSKKGSQTGHSQELQRKSGNRDQQMKSTTIVKHSIKPTMIGNHYYQQLVSFAHESFGKQMIVLKTINENGEVLFENPVPDELATETYTTEVITEPIDDDKTKIIINTFNNNGQSIASNAFMISQSPLADPPNKKTSGLGKSIDGEKNTSVKDMLAKATTIVKHSLKPTLIGNNYYQQIVFHAIGHLGKPSIMVKTINDKGEVLFENQVPTELAGESYITEVIVEPLDEETVKKTIITVNERGQTVASNTFVVSRLQALDDLKTEFIIEAIDNANGRQTINVIQKDVLNPRKTTKRILIRSPTLKNSYYVELESDETDQEGNRLVTLVAKTLEGKQVFKSTHKPTVMGIIGENYFEDLESAVEQMLSKGTEQIVMNPAGQNFSIVIDQDLIDQQGKRTITVSAIDNSGLLLMKKTYQPAINEVLGDHYFDEIIDDIEEGLRVQKVSEFKKKSLISNKLSTMTNRHTFGNKNSSSEDGAGGRNAFFINLVNNIDTSRRTVDARSQQNFSISLKQRSQSAMGSYAQNTRNSSPNATTTRNNQVSFGDPKQSFQNQGRQGSLKPSNTDSNKPTSQRNNTIFNERQSLIHGGVISDEELVRRSLNQGISLNNNQLLLLNPKKSGIVEGNYNEQGSVPSNPMRLAEGSFDDQERTKGNQITFKSQKLANNTSAFLKTISSINPHDSLIETNNLILQKSQEMKQHLENYMDSIKQIQESQINESMKYHDRSGNHDDELLKAKIYEVFNQEKDKLSDQIYKRLQNMTPTDKEDNVMDEFYEFCRSKLPNDDMYKESVLFVSLFYYFLEKKNLIK